MNDPAKLTSKKIENFLSKLSELVDTLPSQETKSQIDQDLDVLIKFLQDFRGWLKSVPTVEDADGIASTIETLKDYVRIAESDPVMSVILGFRSDKGRSKKSSQNSLTEMECKEAKIIAQELRGLSEKEVEDRLADPKKHTVAMLRQIAGELGLRISSKASKKVIVETIIKTIENERGYRILRGASE